MPATKLASGTGGIPANTAESCHEFSTVSGGSFASASVGSCGVNAIRLPHRARNNDVPSESTVSPFLSVIKRRLQ